jgi:anti-anti-sigma regulatory factor
MPTNIVQTLSDDGHRVTLRVEGEMTAADALLLEKIALEMRNDHDGGVTIDLADLHFLDSESAPVIRRLQNEHGFAIEGMEIFLQSAVDSAERNRA